MEVYGLTGGIGSGKSTVAEMLEEYGIPVVSADELSRMVVAPGSEGLADVVEAFGSEVLDQKGELDRKKMGQIVFANPERRRQLESILHPRIRERYEQVLDALEKAGHPVMVYEVPLLFEKKLDEQDEMTAVVLVTASADNRIARVKARDSLTTEDVLARMRAQMPEEEKRQRANYIIHNDGNQDDLRQEVEYLISRFLRLPPRREPGTHDHVDAAGAVSAPPESEIDTLSPEEVDEQPTAEMQVPTGADDEDIEEIEELEELEPQAAISGELEIQVSSAEGDAGSESGDDLQVELSSNPDTPAGLRRGNPSASPAATKPPQTTATPPAAKAPAQAPSAAPPAAKADAPKPPSVSRPPSVGQPAAGPAPPAVPPPGAPGGKASGNSPPSGLRPSQLGKRPRPPRPRSATIPQMSVPAIKPKTDEGDKGDEASDGEPKAGSDGPGEATPTNSDEASK